MKCTPSSGVSTVDKDQKKQETKAAAKGPQQSGEAILPKKAWLAASHCTALFDEHADSCRAVTKNKSNHKHAKTKKQRRGRRPFQSRGSCMVPFTVHSIHIEESDRAPNGVGLARPAGL